jgi:hypothetical protein
MSYFRICFLALLALPVISASAIAENQNNKNQTQKPAVVQQKPAVVQTRPTASQQLNYANQGAAQRNHVFDGTKKPNNPVLANTAPKPNPVGQHVYSTASTPGYKPAQHLHTNPVPSLTVTRSTTTATVTPTRTTTTPTVVRSSTTTTSNSNKKP